MSRIEWTDVTWNPIRGCSRVSEGCRNCYAERIAVRFSGPGKPYEGFADVPAGRRHSQTGTATCGVRGKWTGRVELVPDRLGDPLRWRKARRVFVNSMSDLFHEALLDEAIESVFRIMVLAERHTFQVLTKRPERMREFCLNRSRKHSDAVPPNVWLGVSVEDQKTADERIPLLLRTPAAVRFVSYEPALGPVDFVRGDERRSVRDWLRTRTWETQLTESVTHGLDLVIVGGESGPGARPCDVAWIRSVVRQCREAGVACFVKQLGSAIGSATGRRERVAWDPLAQLPQLKEPGAPFLVKHPKGGDPAEWPEDLRVRELPSERA